MPRPLRSATLRARGGARHVQDAGTRTGRLGAVRAGRRTGAVVAAVVVAALGAVGASGAGVLGGPTATPASGGRVSVAADPAEGPMRPVVDGAAERSSRGPAAGTPAGSAAADPAPADFRTIPLPQLVDRDTVGPLWLTPEDRAAGVLELEVPATGSGVLDVVPGSTAAPGVTGVRTVRVEVERGLAVDGPAFAATVMGTLNDRRGWGARGDVSFARTDGPADIRVVLASPGTTDVLCAPLRTGGEVSCGRNGHAALNARRWVTATPEFADRTLYRHYLVNHEVGHLLGHPHERCPGAGRVAPIMQQQSLAVAPCTANGWPFPQG